MKTKIKNKFFYFIVSTVIAFSLILTIGSAWAVMMDRPKPEPMQPVPGGPIVPLNDCGEYQYDDCQRDYNWCQQFNNPSACWTYVGSCVKQGRSSTHCRQTCAQYGVHCQSR
ncbi:MAG: hypothetical protein HXY53_04975 [Nitrospirae bacterium]|nr:hypothetical protein [Nitrospirota bacterium]